MLLGITDPNLLAWHPLQGSLFENMVIIELLKRNFNRGLWTQFYFWRESNGVEVDCLIEREGKILPIEIKSTQTLTSFSTSNLKKLVNLMSDHTVEPYIVYGGKQSLNNQGIDVLSWRNLDILIDKQ